MKLPKIVALFGAALYMLGCTFGSDPDVDRQYVDINSLISTNMQTAAGIGGTLTVSTTAPFWEDEFNVLKDGERSDWPWRGQHTRWTVELVEGNIYKVSVTTEYEDLLIDRYNEVYYIKDVNGNGVWDDGDLYVDPNGARNSIHRDKMTVHFANGSNRDEEIVWDSLLDSERPDVNNVTFSPNSEFSSVVEYFFQHNEFSSVTRINGTRVYENLGNNAERIQIREKGTSVNVIIDSVQRGQADVKGYIDIQINDGIPTDVSGQYTVTTRNDVFVLDVFP